MRLSKQSTLSAYAVTAYALGVAGLPTLPGLPALPIPTPSISAPVVPGLPPAAVPPVPVPTPALPAPVFPGLPPAVLPPVPASTPALSGPVLPALSVPKPALSIPTPSLGLPTLPVPTTLPIPTQGLPTLPVPPPALAAPALTYSTPSLPVPSFPVQSVIPTSGLPALPGVSSLPSNVPAVPASLPIDPSVVLKNNIVEAIQILEYIATELLNIPVPGLGSVGVGSALIPFLLSKVVGLLSVPGI
ncbi:MAG: hypothetical protein HETSPECPRED_009806 [Heterodermia speciosa]|uniref:Uncharacterized protein n=1 Tax=Heterodermia speciosa TaxID=116794 RepID=A0A8H3G3E7_9LECA|nr:MAG: hypothetical protein HETSPECPRED_009806 [Heterodermia speciosa]